MIGSEAKKRYLWHPLLLVLLAYLIVVIIHSLMVNNKSLNAWLFVAGWGLLYTLIFLGGPILILFLTHLKSSKGKSIFSNASKLDAFSTRNNTYKILNDIDYVEHYLSHPSFYGKFDWSFWNHFYYFVFVTKSGSRIVLSCLLLDSKSIPDYLVIKKRRNCF